MRFRVSRRNPPGIWRCSVTGRNALRSRAGGIEGQFYGLRCCATCLGVAGAACAGSRAWPLPGGAGCTPKGPRRRTSPAGSWASRRVASSTRRCNVRSPGKVLHGPWRRPPGRCASGARRCAESFLCARRARRKAPGGCASGTGGAYPALREGASSLCFRLRVTGREAAERALVMTWSGGAPGQAPGGACSLRSGPAGCGSGGPSCRIAW